MRTALSVQTLDCDHVDLKLLHMLIILVKKGVFINLFSVHVKLFL